VSAEQVREALFTQAVNKAPGADGIGFVVIRFLHARMFYGSTWLRNVIRM